MLFLGFVRKAKKKAFSDGHITGIIFHNPEKATFNKAIRWLTRNGYSFISTKQLLEYIRNGSTPPKGALWLTLDDGWKDNLFNVIPTIVKHKIPVTFFITTDPIENNRCFWWSLVNKYEKQLLKYYRIKKKDLYYVSESQRKKIMIEMYKMYKENFYNEAMTIKELQDIVRIPYVSLGSHTVHHVITPNCTEEELRVEISECKQKLENWTGTEVISFAYPSGRFDGKEINILEEFGIEIAATSENRLISIMDNPYLIPRFSAIDNGCHVENICRMVGIWEPAVQRIKKIVNQIQLKHSMRIQRC